MGEIPGTKISSRKVVFLSQGDVLVLGIADAELSREEARALSDLFQSIGIKTLLINAAVHMAVVNEDLYTSLFKDAQDISDALEQGVVFVDKAKHS